MSKDTNTQVQVAEHRQADAPAKMDAHVLAWIAATCVYRSLPYRKSGCLTCCAFWKCPQSK